MAAIGRYGRWSLRSDDLALPELLPMANGDASDFRIFVTSVDQPALAEWLYEVYDEDGTTCFLRVARSQSGYLLDFPEIARIAVDLAPGRIDVRPEPTTSPVALRHLLLDHVMPRLLSLHGVAVLHATAVRGPAGTLAFVAPSGYGKSTLALSLALAGHPLQADDCLILDGGAEYPTPFVIPSYPGGRLWPDSAAALAGESAPGKNSLEVPFEAEPSPLAAVFVLAPSTDDRSEQVARERLSGREAFLELMGQGFHLDASGSAANRTLLDIFGRVAATVPMFRLSYPRDLSRLAEVHHAVLAAVGSVEI